MTGRHDRTATASTTAASAHVDDDYQRGRRDEAIDETDRPARFDRDDVAARERRRERDEPAVLTLQARGRCVSSSARASSALSGGGDVEALRELAAEHLQVVELLALLDAVGDHLEPEVVREADDRAHDLERARVVADAGHQRARDLDRVAREAVQQPQRRRARAEVVDVRVHAELLERLLEHLAGGFVGAAAAQIVLGDLEPQRPRVQPGLVEVRRSIAMKPGSPAGVRRR